MHVSAQAALVVAIVGLAVGAISLGLAWWGFVKVRRVRDAQRQMLGGGRRDLVEFAVTLQGRVDDLHRAVDEVAAGLQRVDRRVDGVVSNSSIVRYDAYENTGGHQSASLALLDSARSGVVVTAIQGRDYARIYMKELDRGRASVDLSPPPPAPSPTLSTRPFVWSGRTHDTVIVADAPAEPVRPRKSKSPTHPS